MEIGASHSENPHIYDQGNENDELHSTNSGEEIVTRE